MSIRRSRQWHPTAVLLPGKSHGWRSLVGCSPWGRWGLDMAERLHFHFSLSCIGEGNGNPLQCSCLENPRNGGAWWAAVSGVAQSRTRLKWLSSSSVHKMNVYLSIYSSTLFFRAVRFSIYFLPQCVHLSNHQHAVPVVHWLQSMNLHWHIIVTQSP